MIWYGFATDFRKVLDEFVAGKRDTGALTGKW
jgi:hypothetical protein